MAVKKATKKVRAGLGRGCPKCGSHDTDALRLRDGTLGAMWCRACEWRWKPCDRPYCKGYVLDMEATDGPEIRGCRGCGVPNHIARRWPEAYRMMYRTLLEQTDKLKRLEL